MLSHKNSFTMTKNLLVVSLLRSALYLYIYQTFRTLPQLSVYVPLNLHK